MRTLIIPDIHNRYAVAEAIIDKENADNVVLLGDYFDSFGDDSDVETVSNTARWLAESVKKTNRLHLIGNHDLWYSHGSCRPYCAGNSEFKFFIIKQYFKEWDKLKFFCYVDDWLCTHAGLSDRIYQEYKKEGFTVLELLNDVERLGRSHPLISLCGEARGGIEGEVGGILWCDYSEFEDIYNTKQIFGHTNDKFVRQNQFHACIDTGLRNYAVITDNELIVKSSNGSTKEVSHE